MKSPSHRCWALLAVLSLGSLSSAEMVTRRFGRPPTGLALKGPEAPPPTGYAPVAAAAPGIDGKLTDACWKDAPVMRLARTLEGGAKAAQPTEVKAVRHGGSLYVAFRCVEPAPGKIRAPRRGHDGEIWSDDSIEMFLGFGGTYYHFGVNAAGSTYDGKVKNSSWNSGLRAATARAGRAWTAELTIPLAKMVGTGKLPPSCIANFNRNRHAGGSWQEAAWSPTLSGNSHVPQRFGKLVFAGPPKPAPDRPVIERGTVTILPSATGKGVVRFDLSELPAGAKVYRADLLVFRTARLTGANDDALTSIEVYPLFSKFKARGTPKVSGKPLGLRGPWFDRFDATAAVRQWVSGKANGGFFVKTCPFINLGGTPPDLPPQVAGVSAFHRAGQTFITFKESLLPGGQVDDPVGTDTVNWGRLRRIIEGLDQIRRVRYCVYRSRKPISAATLPQAERIAIVRPLSCWNVNGRSLDKAIDQMLASEETVIGGQWNPFSRSSTDGRHGVDCLMERLVVREGQGPLPRGTGLYVHTAGEAGKAHYAVITSVNGVENTRDLSAKNVASVEEKAGAGEPVLQKVFPPRPYFNYRQKRLHYVRWVAPPYVNLPSQYYNWSVGVPEKQTGKMPLELSLHRDGRSYYRTQYRIEQDSLVIAPHDFPIKTWWYGYHESVGTLKSFRQGVVHNYTERRLLAFIEWAAKRWPVDRKRMLVTGCGGGAAGGGALHLGVRHPEVFNLVVSGYGLANYAGALDALIAIKRARSLPVQMESIWGKVQWNLKTDTGKGTPDRGGSRSGEPGSVWDELNLTKIVRDLPRTTELPMITVTGRGIMKPQRDFYVALLERGHPFMARHGVYGGGTLLPITMTGTWSRMIRLDVRKNLSQPAFRGPAAAGLFVQPKEPSGNLVVSDGINYYWGDIHTGCRWKDISDAPARYETTLYWAGSTRVRNPVADVTIRRLQKFQLRPGRQYSYEVRNPAGEVLRQGRADPSATGGLLRFKALPIPSEGVRLIVKP